WADSRQAAEMLASIDRTNLDVLAFLHKSNLLLLEPRIARYVQPDEEGQPKAIIEATGDQDAELESMKAFLACPAREFIGYDEYLSQESPFSTHQGVKGAEFERVILVLDDEEG